MHHLFTSDYLHNTHSPVLGPRHNPLIVPYVHSTNAATAISSALIVLHLATTPVPDNVGS